MSPTRSDVSRGVNICGIDFIGPCLYRQGHLGPPLPPQYMRETVSLHGLEALVEEEGVENIFTGWISRDNAS